MRQTELLELMRRVRVGLSLSAEHYSTTHYEGDTLKTVLRWLDGKLYSIVIREVPPGIRLATEDENGN